MYSFLSSSNEAVKFNVENLKRKHCQVNVYSLLIVAVFTFFFFQFFIQGLMKMILNCSLIFILERKLISVAGSVCKFHSLNSHL